MRDKTAVTVKRRLWIVLLVTATAFIQQVALAQSLTINKIEPPNWWVGMKWNRVQLMLYGENLRGIEVSSSSPQLMVSNVYSSDNPSYAFVDVDISPDVKPGTYVMSIQSGHESVEVEYPILARNSDPRRHAGFGPQDVIYLITPDRFANGDPSNDRAEDRFDDFDPGDHRKRHGGDLKGIIDRLDYLDDLGFTAIWLNPVLENMRPGSYHGFATTDYYRIDPRFGSNEDFRKLVVEAHKRNMKVIFDHVNNHIGIEHPWMKNLPSDDWLNGSVEDHIAGLHYKLSDRDPHADPKMVEMFRNSWFVHSTPDLNQRNPYMANYLIQNTLWWIEFSGMDGIREDTYNYPDPRFMADWGKAVMEEYPNFNIVGEIWEFPASFPASFQKDTFFPNEFEAHLPAVTDFPLMVALRDFVTGAGIRTVYRAFTQDFVYADYNNTVTFIDNHDTPRIFDIARGRIDRIKLGLAMLLTTRGIPQILYGTEIGLLSTGEQHSQIRSDFTGGFPGDPRNAFTKEGRTPEENALFDYLRKLLNLREEYPALALGKMVHWIPKDEIYMYKKTLDDKCIVIIVNESNEERQIDLSNVYHWFHGIEELHNLLSGESIPFERELDLRLAGMQVGIFELREPSQD